MRRSGLAHFIVLAGAAVPVGALAAPVAGLAISNGPTRDVACSAGVCTSAAQSAVLNVGDLVAMLAAGPVVVKTAARGPDISIEAPLAWSGTNTLTLDSYHSVRGDRPVAVPAGAGLVIVTDDQAFAPSSPGMLSFGPHGRVDFASLSSTLAINGVAYVLVDSVAGLASEVAANPAGAFALAADYDAGVDGVYSASPVSTPLQGEFQGLGHTISRVTIRSLASQSYVGLFSEILTGATAEDLRLTKERVKGGAGARVGGFAGVILGFVQNVSVDGEVSGGGQSFAGGLVGTASAEMIDLCSATVTVNAGTHAAVGGLIGYASAFVATRSFATGMVSGGEKSYVGGLAGYLYQATQIFNSYATGSATGGNESHVGGLVGKGIDNFVQTSYSTGSIATGPIGASGGFSSSVRSCVYCYWDTTTSGTLDGVAGGNNPAILPLTTPQLQAGLPGGFDDTIWGQNPTINGGLPYLLDNPPPYSAAAVADGDALDRADQGAR